MKKLLLSLLAVAGLSFAASAETTTFTKVTSDDQLVDGAEYVILSCPKLVGKVQYGPFAMAAAKSNKAGFATYEVEADVTDLAASYDIDKSNITTITLEKATDGWNLKSGDSYINTSTVKKMQLGTTATTFTITTSADNTTFKYSGGSIRATHSNGTGGVKGTVTINTYASDQNDVVLYKAETTPVNPDLQPAGLKYETTSYNVELGETFTAPKLTNPNGLTVAYSSSKPEVATVNATTGAVEIVGVGTTTISAKSEETAIYNAGSASYTITVTAPVQTIASIAATKELADNTNFKVGYELTVGFKNGSNVFACDAAGDFIQIYGSNSYNIGDKIPAGWIGEYVLYKGNTPEITPVGNLPEAEAGTFTPAVVSATDISNELVNSVVTINNVELAEATPGEDVTESNAKNFTGTVGGTTLNFRNNYKLASVDAGTYNITVVVMLFNDAPSLYVTNFENVDFTGIDGVVVDENAPVEYYNLQGVRVANPENGLYIRRQGNKATKVLVK